MVRKLKQVKQKRAWVVDVVWGDGWKHRGQDWFLRQCWHVGRLHCRQVEAVSGVEQVWQFLERLEVEGVLLVELSRLVWLGFVV